MESAREKILQALEEQIKTIPGIGRVSRGKIDPLALQNFPAVFIQAGDDVVNALLNDFYDRTWTVLIFSWVHTVIDISQEIEAHIAALSQKINEDFTLGGKVMSIFESAAREPFPLNDEQTDAGIIHEYEIRYRTPRDDPYTLLSP